MPAAPRPIEERFWPKVDRRGPDECWPWLASINQKGYGKFRVGGRSGAMVPAHRVAYELCIGPIPDGADLDHVRDRGCTMRHCVNPAHLEPVTTAENLYRGDLRANNGNALKTHCPRNHPYSKANTYIKGGRRNCRTCRREEKRAARKVRASCAC